jgi:hypothetical protein
MTKEQIDRLEYAIANPWVFKYDFGHIELLRKYYEITDFCRLHDGVSE